MLVVTQSALETSPEVQTISSLFDTLDIPSRVNTALYITAFLARAAHVKFRFRLRVHRV